VDKRIKHNDETWPVIDPFFREMPEAIGKRAHFHFHGSVKYGLVKYNG
jgi:hypothetical protein